MGGWLHNNAEPIANPYYDPAVLPAGTAILPGRSSKRIGEHEWMGRATLELDNRGPFTASAKLFATRYNGDGAAAFAQNIGPCAADGKPRPYGNVHQIGRAHVQPPVTNALL